MKRGLRWPSGSTQPGLNRPLANAAASKYRNKPTNGYASAKEAKRAVELALLQKGGAIRNLREQVEFELIPKQVGERACAYRADFVYETKEGAMVVEDAKGMRTPAYVIKRKLMLWVHGVRIVEV